MAITYEPIATTTLSTAGAITFTSIPSTYTDLILVISGNNINSTAQLYMRLNSDGGSNYGTTYMYGNGSSAGSSNQSPYSFAAASRGTMTSEQFTSIVHFMNYANTSIRKTFLVRTSQSNSETYASADQWSSTSAISSITFSQTLGNMAVGTTATLYGIKAA